jgi:hypothetical protein
MSQISVFSEFGTLEGVIVHTPGAEVEKMTPLSAKRALYSDILNLSVAREEYSLFKGVLSRFSPVYEVKDCCRLFSIIQRLSGNFYLKYAIVKVHLIFSITFYLNLRMKQPAYCSRGSTLPVTTLPASYR